MKSSYLIIATVISTATLSSAATIISSDFDSNDVSTGSEATGISWTTGTGVSMLNSGNLSSVNGFNFGVLGDQSTSDNISIDSNLNSARATGRGYTVSFSLTTAYDLTSLLGGVDKLII